MKRNAKESALYKRGWTIDDSLNNITCLTCGRFFFYCAKGTSRAKPIDPSFKPKACPHCGIAFIGEKVEPWGQAQEGQ